MADLIPYILAALGLVSATIAGKAWLNARDKSKRLEGRLEALAAQQAKARETLARLEKIDASADEKAKTRVEKAKSKLRSVLEQEDPSEMFDKLVEDANKLAQHLLD